MDFDYTANLFNKGSEINKSRKEKSEIIYTSRWRYFLSKYKIIKNTKLIIPKSILNILSTLGVRKYNLSDYKDEIMKKK